MLATTCARTESVPRITVFGPHPLLTVAIERRPGDSAGGDDIHLHAGGQGVWVSRSAATLGAEPVLCGFVGAETGQVLRPLLEALPGERHLVRTAGPSGCYVVDRREGSRTIVSQSWTTPPSRHELDDLFSATCGAALASDALVVGNPFRATSCRSTCTPTWSRTCRAVASPSTSTSPRRGSTARSRGAPLS